MVVTVERRRGGAAELHRLDPFASDGTGSGAPVRVWVCEPRRPALVLGSRQRRDVVDAAWCARLGVEIVERRSGGGAVLVDPDDALWIDLVARAGAVPDDVRGSMVWAGEIWLDAMVASGADPGAFEIHRGGLVETPWSGLVCFAGVGPGEVLHQGRKLVGLSQRRTRYGVRIQGLVHRRSALGSLGAMLVEPLRPPDPLAEPATLAEAGLGTLDADEFAERLATAADARIASA